MNNHQPIGALDSGVGGLSIVHEMQKFLPKESFVFVADQAFVPYGGKNKHELLDRVEKLIKFLVSKDVKLIVFACNTATVYTINEMREKFKLPIVGTVPVVKTLAERTRTKKVGVLSTPATTKSEYLRELCEKFASGVDVVQIGGSRLEELVEEGRVPNDKTEKILRKILLPLVKDGVDAIALGCTHYPFLRSQVEGIVGPDVLVFDSGPAISRRVRVILENENVLSDKKKEDFYYTTGDRNRFKKVAEGLLGEKLRNVANVKL